MRARQSFIDNCHKIFKAKYLSTNCHKNLRAKYLSLATNPAGASLGGVLCCLLCLLRSLVLDNGLLDGGFLLVLGGANSLLPLGFSHLRLLVPLCHDILQNPGGWRCLHLHHHRRSVHQVCCEEAEGDEGGLNAALVILITSPQLAGIRQNCDGADSEPRYFLFHTVPPDITPCGRFRKKKK